jgi:DNA-binding XRE family transcriptional regulator
MIANEREFRITQGWAKKFAEAIDSLSQEDPSLRPDLHPLLRKAELESLQSQLGTFKEELAEYEALRAGERSLLKADSLADLPRALIQARIAAGLTQRQLGERLGIAEQQIQKYEANEYRHASFARLLEIAKALEIAVRSEVHLNPDRGLRPPP